MEKKHNYFLISVFLNFLPSLSGEHLRFKITGATAVQNITSIKEHGLYCDPSSHCQVDSDCNVCSMLDIPYTCTIVGEVEDFCVFCNTYTELGTCPDGICAYGPSFYNSENCYSECCSDSWGPDFTKIFSCTLGTEETGLVKQKEKQEATKLKFQQHNKLNNAEFVKKLQELQKEL